MPAVYLDGRDLVRRACRSTSIQRVLDPALAASPSSSSSSSRRGSMPRRVRRMLDIGTGSGCIAHRLRARVSAARVDAVDISRRRARSRAHQRAAPSAWQGACGSLESDHFSALGGERYDIIVTQSALRRRARDARVCRPSTATSRDIALAVGPRRSRFRARSSCAKRRGICGRDGLLVVEVGNTETALCAAFPQAAVHLARLRARWRRCVPADGGTAATASG